MIPFSPPYVDKDIIDEVTATLNSGWITTGPRSRELENTIINYCGCKSAVCVNSATSGLFLALKWYGIGPGDEVIVPAYTYAATALVVYHAGATPVMVDVNDDFNINIHEARKAITTKTKAIIPVDFSGWPCDYNELYSLLNEDVIKRKFNPVTENQKKLGRILIISDSAHSIGASYFGKKTGSCTDISVFSLHAVKNVTSAEGGVICINLPDFFSIPEVTQVFRLLSLNGQTKDAFTKTQAGSWRYDIIFPGYKFNMPDLCAAIALVQLRKYESFLLPERKRVFYRYYDAFSAYSWAIMPPVDNEVKHSSYHLFPLRFKDVEEERRDKMIELITQHGVAVNVHFLPLPMLTAFREMGFSIDNFPVAYSNYKKEISLPIYPQLTDKQVDIIINTVIDAYQNTK